MVSALLDTSVVIDLLRKYALAERWLEKQSKCGVSRPVWIEVLEGVSTRDKQRQAFKLLRRFELVELTTDDLLWATDALIKYRLSHNVDGYDCMIAAVAHRMQVPLYSHNLKHFTPLIGSQVVKPY